MFSPAWPLSVALHLLRTVVPMSGFLFDAGKEWTEASERAAALAKRGDQPEHYQAAWVEYRTNIFELFTSPQ